MYDTMNGFAVVGCSKCQRKMVADLSFEHKTCQCGHRINLHKVHLLATAATAAQAGEILRAMNAQRNTGFTSAQNFGK